MAVTKRTRYEVLRRDGYACRYCGSMAPEAALTIDHVMPKSLGGSDGPENLVAACKHCNMGKASSSPDAELLSDVSDDAIRYAAAIRQAADEMLDAFTVASDDEQAFFDAWNTYHDNYGDVPPLPADWAVSVRQWLNMGLPVEVLLTSIAIAMSSQAAVDKKFRYFAGICHNKANALQARAREIFDSVPDPEPLPAIERDPSEPLPVSFDVYQALSQERTKALPVRLLEAFIDRRLPAAEMVA